jgi:hypothetical protein
MNPMQLQDLAAQRRAMILSAAAGNRDATGHLLRPTLGTRIGRVLVDAGTRLLARADS